MSEDKDSESSKTPTADAVEQWLSQSSRNNPGDNEDSVEDRNPQKDQVKRLFYLGSRLLKTADSLDWSSKDIQREAFANELSYIELESGKKSISFSPFLHEETVNLQLNGRQINQVEFYKGDLFRNFEGFFGDTPIYVVGLVTHDEKNQAVVSYDYAFTAAGDCVRLHRVLSEKVHKIHEHTREVNPTELSIAEVAIDLLSDQLEKLSPTAPV